MLKSIWKITGIFLLSVLLLVGCGRTRENEVPDQNLTNTTAPTKAAEKADSESADTEDAASTDGQGSLEETEGASGVDPNYDPSFEVILEAEEAQFTGNVKVENIAQGYTGSGYLTGIQADTDTITFVVTVPGDGAYNLNFVSAGNTGYKENNILLDGMNIGVSVVDKNEFMDSIMERVYLTAGEHQITMTKSWGWILLDSLIIKAAGPADLSIYDVSAELVDPLASDRTKRLMQYLADMYGEYILSGQYGDMGIIGAEFTAIKNATGKYPAILGLDFIENTPSRVANGSISYDVDYAKKFDQDGGIVTFAWHWNAPEPYLINSSDKPWWRGFYTDATTIDLKKIMDGGDPEGYDLLLRDIDAIAEQLKLLEKADIPILWRPLHEASGGWFWWGASGPEAYIKLYQLLFDRLVNVHNIHNLIWVWNGQNKDWYPGDEYVDIVGTDIYPGERVYSSQAAKFNELVEWNGADKKIVALTENGCLFDPELALRDNAMWSYFGTWEGDFVVINKTYTLSEQYTEIEMLKKVYTSDRVITLDELPDLRTYGD